MRILKAVFSGSEPYIVLEIVDEKLKEFLCNSKTFARNKITFFWEADSNKLTISANTFTALQQFVQFFLKTLQGQKLISVQNRTVLEEDIAEQKSIGPASTTQIAILHNLLRESEALSRQINYPVSSGVFAMMITGINNILPEPEAILKILTQDNPVWTIAAIATFGGVFFYSYFKLWKLISNASLAAFPNGIGYTRTPHPAHTMQKKLGSNLEVAKGTNDLQGLIKQQRVTRNRSLALSVVISAAVSFLTSGIKFVLKSDGTYLRIYPAIRTPSYIGLKSTRFGPVINFDFSDEKGIIIEPTGLMGFIRTIADAMQSIPVLGRVYNYWSNYNTPKQLKNYAANLNLLPACTWSVVAGTEKSKTTALFSLNQSGKKFTEFNDSQGRKQRISTKNFLIELHRALLIEGIPVFRSSDEIYVAYSDSLNKKLQTIKLKFTDSLVRAVHHEKCVDDTLEKLDQLKNVIPRQYDIESWKYYRGLDDKGDLQTYYYLNLNQLPRKTAQIFTAALLKFIPRDHLKIEDNIITVSMVPDDIKNLVTIVQQLKGSLYPSPSSNPTSNPEQSVTSRDFKEEIDPVTEVQESEAVKGEEKETKAPNVTRKTPVYPSVIHFGKGIRFFKEEEDENKHSPGRAYPLLVSRFKEGRAYASIDPRVVQQVSDYVSEEDIINRLRRGKTHSSKKGSKNKAGGVGIQNTVESYTNVYGEKIACASFKLKFANNVRIFGHMVEEEDPTYLHCRLDGWSLGHS